jgi:hypothetical protein
LSFSVAITMVMPELHRPNQKPQSIHIFHVLLWAFDGNSSSVWLAAAVIACSVVARLGSLGSTIAMEKKWAMALS